MPGVDSEASGGWATRWISTARGWFDPRARHGQLAVAAALVLATTLTALALLLRPDTRTTASPPTPPSVAATAGPGTSAPSPSSTATPRATDTSFRCAPARTTGDSSSPSRICLPGIDVDASVMELGLNRDRTVQVPPLSRVQDAGWYRNSAAPGTVGPTVVLGHVDSAEYGAGVFFRLAKLHKGDRILVTREDGRVATYLVDRLEQVSKSRFPSQEVYGATSGPAIRLVTCGGRYNPSTGSYVDNIIVYGTLQSLRRG